MYFAVPCHSKEEEMLNLEKPHHLLVKNSPLWLQKLRTWHKACVPSETLHIFCWFKNLLRRNIRSISNNHQGQNRTKRSPNGKCHANLWNNPNSGSGTHLQKHKIEFWVSPPGFADTLAQIKAPPQSLREHTKPNKELKLWKKFWQHFHGIKKKNQRKEFVKVYPIWQLF